MSSARPMEIVASTRVMSVSNVFVLFHYLLLWKAKLDLSALGEGFDSWYIINVSFNTGSIIASCGAMKTPSCIIL